VYASSEPDERRGVLESYQSTIWDELPNSLFTADTLANFEAITANYHTKHQAVSADIKQRELERFVIELSWKSSRIEGNTYTLLDAERLLREGVPSSTNTEEETIMILNHKTAFDFVYKNRLFQGNTLTRAYVEEVHNLLMTGLLNDTGLRKFGVGITGSRYKPLDNQFLIKEALDDGIRAINKATSVYDKALLALLAISYMQPFVDGNKRTARLVANALLLSGDASPLSYRSVDEVTYRATLLTFYEQLSIVPMREIFIEQYHFATEQY
jgi:Fic family protein